MRTIASLLVVVEIGVGLGLGKGHGEALRWEEEERSLVHSPQVELNWPTPEVERVLRATPAEVAPDHLGRLAAEGNPSVRAVLIMQLARCPVSDSKAAEAIVLASLEDKDPLVRRTAAHAIGFLEPRDHLKRGLVKEVERGLSLLSRLDPGVSGHQKPGSGPQSGALDAEQLRRGLEELQRDMGKSINRLREMDPPLYGKVERSAEQLLEQEKLRAEMAVGVHAARALGRCEGKELAPFLRRVFDRLSRSHHPESCLGAAEALFELRDAVGISMVIRHFEEYRDKLRAGSIAPAGALHYCTLLHRRLYSYRDPAAEIPIDLQADAAAGWREWFGTVRSTLK